MRHRLLWNKELECKRCMHRLPMILQMDSLVLNYGQEQRKIKNLSPINICTLNGYWTYSEVKHS